MSDNKKSSLFIPDRCFTAVKDAMRESREPMRHLHVVDARHEWSGMVGDALAELIKRGEVVSLPDADGYTRYALVRSGNNGE